MSEILFRQGFKLYFFGSLILLGKGKFFDYRKCSIKGKKPKKGNIVKHLYNRFMLP